MSDYNNKQFNQFIAQLLFYRTKYGDLNIPEDYISADKFPLGEFVRKVRKEYLEGRLDGDKKSRLNEIGFEMDASYQNWRIMFLYTKEYVLSHEGEIPGSFEKTDDNALIGAWVRKQMLTFDALQPYQQESLRELGICVE